MEMLWGGGGGGCCKAYLNSLKVVQKKILRIMSFKGKFEHTAPLFTAFNILPIQQVNSYMYLIYVYRCLKNETDNTFLPYIPIHYQTLSQTIDPSIPDSLCAGEATSYGIQLLQILWKYSSVTPLKLI